MTTTVTLPLWLFVLIVLFAAVTFASHFLFPSVRWFLRRRLERAVSRLNERLTRPIEPFKLARRTDMIQRLIYDPEVTQAIVDEARERGEREDVTFQRAQRYAREIVPSFSAFAYFGVGARAARWLARLLYDVREPNMDVLSDVPPDTTVVFVMNHRSNMDYVLVTYLAARASALSYAVGEWARIWPLSRLIRSMGAYFIRRKSRGQLYRKVLARYVQMATAAGSTQAIFPEGGLSLDGRLMPPKLGILAYVVAAWEREGRDVAFVPVAIGYDRVLEDRVLIAAHERGDRRFGAKISVVMGFVLKMLWLKITGRFQRFGRAEVVFGAPVVLSKIADPHDVTKLAETLMHEISDHIPLLPIPAIAAALKDGPLGMEALKEKVADAGIDAESTLHALNILEQRGLILRRSDQLEVNPEERGLIQFYSNAASAKL